MKLAPGGQPVDFSRGAAHVVAMIDARLAELRSEEQATLFDREAERARKAEETRKEATATLLKYSGVPDRYHGATLAGWQPQGDKEAIQKPKMIAWAAGVDMAGSASAVWIGPPGTGKTHLGCGLLMDRFQVGKDGYYTTAKGYTDRIKNSYRQDSPESSTDVLQRFASVPVLVIDEVGRQFEAKSEELYFFELINERYNKRRPTLFLSNLSDEEFRTFVGSAVMDRLKEGGGRFLPFNWESRRI